jgi:transcriptional regulator with XRE-family HTH domain
MYNDNLRALRTANGLSQKIVADKIDKERSAYAYYELGKSEPSIETLKKLAKLFNVSVDFIVGMDEVPSKVAQKDSGYSKLAVDPAVVSDLEKDEKDLIASYRLLSDADKKAILDSANSLLSRRK